MQSIDSTRPVRVDHSVVRSRGSLFRWVILSALLAGALDLTFAFLFYGRQGASPGMILRGIASGLVGASARQGSDWYEALGLFLHFAISLSAAALFAWVTSWSPALQRRPVIIGAVFGVLTYVVMHSVVLPLSQAHAGHPPLGNIVGELCSHVFLFGIVIAWGVAHGRKQRGA